MAKKQTDFFIVLKDGISAETLRLMRPVIHNLTLDTGLVAHVLHCKWVDQNGPYLSLVAELSTKDGFTHIQIPYDLVLVIAGSKNKPPIGFTSSEEYREHSKEIE